MSPAGGTVGNIDGIDIGVIVAYFVIVIGFGIWASLKNRGSVGGYFLAGRSMHFILIGASLFSSNIGSGHFIGLAGSGASSGIGIAAFELNAIFVLMILGWFFVPVYVASGVFTMPEYILKRFGGQRIRIYLSVLALLLSIFTKIAADLYAGALFITLAIGWNIYLAIVVLLAIAAIFTITGGLTAVMWTDFIQTIIMIIGAVYLMIVSFIKVGGFEPVSRRYMDAIPNTTIFYRMAVPNNYSYKDCGFPPDTSFHFFRPPDDPGLPWPGIIFGLTISSVWYWCSDQVIVQRALSAKDFSHAKAGCVLAGYLKFLPLWIIILPGMISRILFTDEIACADPNLCEEICGSRAGCTNIAYPTLVIRLMPVGARGLMLAVMLSALMSSLTSVFNSSSTIFTMDIWRQFRKNSNEMELMVVGRVFVLIMVGLSIAWIPIVQNFSELFNYIQSVTSYLSPPICAVYVLAIFWKRANEFGAFWGLMIGLVIGIIRFAWESAYTQVICGLEGEDKRPSIIKDVHYLYFGMLLFGIVFIIVIVLSLLTKPIPDKHLHRLTFWDRFSEAERVDLDRSDDTKSHEAKEPTSPPEDEDEDVPCWRKGVNWICGIEKHPEMILTAEEKKAQERKQTSLEEVPIYRKLCNINAIMLMSFALFLWGFFA